MTSATIEYTPRVGDAFHKPAGKTQSATGETIPSPERNAKVTAMSHGHVVCVIEGHEYTLTRGDFIRLAKRSLANGATLTRDALDDHAKCRNIVEEAWAAGCENKDQVIGYLSKQVLDLQEAKQTEREGV